MKDTIIYFDLFDTLIKIDRGYLEEYFDSELDLLGDKGILKDSKMTINEIIKKHPSILDKHSLEEMSSYYESVMFKSLSNVSTEILFMLESLKGLGYRMCIISDAAYVDIQGFDNSPLSKFFEKTVFSCEHGVTKPDKKIYDIAYDVMGNPTNAIFVGDGGHSEIIGAKENGMKTIKVEWFKKNDFYNSSDYVCNVPEHVVRVIENISK